MSLLQIFSVLLRRNPNLDRSIFCRHTVAYLHAKMMNSSQLETIRQMKYLEWATRQKYKQLIYFLAQLTFFNEIFYYNKITQLVFIILHYMFNTYSKEESVQNISEYGISNRTGIQPFSPSLNQPSLSFVPIYLAIHLKVSLGYPMQRASPDWLKIDQWVSLKGTRWNDRLH